MPQTTTADQACVADNSHMREQVVWDASTGNPQYDANGNRVTTQQPVGWCATHSIYWRRSHPLCDAMPLNRNTTEPCVFTDLTPPTTDEYGRPRVTDHNEPDTDAQTVCLTHRTTDTGFGADTQNGVCWAGRRAAQAAQEERDRQRAIAAQLRAQQRAQRVAEREDVVPTERGRHTNCSCEACKFRKFDDTSVLAGALGHIDGAYSAPPGGWRKRGAGTYWLGVELETDWVEGLYGARLPQGERAVDPQRAVLLTRPDDGFWWPKSDSSVSGPEFASMPATFDVWKSYTDDMAEMLRMLVHAGYRSHQGDHCGMHVSFSKTAIDNGPHLLRLLGLIHRSPQWSLTMSQRTQTSVRWSKLTDVATLAQRQAYVRQAMRPTDRWGNSVWSFDRYIALNNPTDNSSHATGRYEFRLPRGTLRLDRFYKNVEWITAMIEYTRDDGHKDWCAGGQTSVLAASPTAFGRWVADSAATYPNLHSFMCEKSLIK